jgi:hypothetical protein
MQNKHKARRDNKCGLLGVVAHAGGTWRARIRANGVTHHVGLYPTPEAAHEAYLEAKRRLHPGCTI